MRLDPVFLVAPEPDPPRTPGVSRRTFLAGLLGGTGLGALLGATVLRDPVEPATAGLRNDSESLSWALRLQDGALEELLANHATFLLVFAEERDARLVPGIERLVLAVLERDASIRDVAPALASSLATEIESHPVAASLRPYVNQLRRIR
jgi:hypothetical protein